MAPVSDDDNARLDAALAAISDPARLADAQDLVARAMPGLQQVFASALADGGWFDTAHAAALREAVLAEDADQRLRIAHSLIAEETRLSMLVGVAIGLELARELGYAPEPDPEKED